MTDYHWDHFKRLRYVKGSVDLVSDYWLKADLIAKWFLKRATYTSPKGKQRSGGEYPQVGDKYHWSWIQDIEATGEVLEVIPGKVFSVTFGENADTKEPVIVQVTFEQDPNRPDETIIRLEQSNMGGDLSQTAHYHLSCNKGWDYFLTNLKALLNYGVDLREQDSTRSYNELSVSL